MTYVDLRPDNVRPVEVQLGDGVSVYGMLEAGAQGRGVWQGWARYSVTSEQRTFGDVCWVVRRATGSTR